MKFWNNLTLWERIGLIGSLAFSLLTILFVYLGSGTSFSSGLYIGCFTMIAASCFQALFRWRSSKGKALIPVAGAVALLIFLIVYHS